MEKRIFLKTENISIILNLETSLKKSEEIDLDIDNLYQKHNLKTFHKKRSHQK